MDADGENEGVEGVASTSEHGARKGPSPKTTTVKEELMNKKTYCIISAGTGDRIALEEWDTDGHWRAFVMTPTQARQIAEKLVAMAAETERGEWDITQGKILCASAKAVTSDPDLLDKFDDGWIQ